ncbi:MAG: hypothetical protein L0H41_13315, partial [Microlunatus sp.]|nr:hypothetical protein [Microlunatus sp.]
MVHGDDANPYHGWEWLTWIAPLLSCAFVPLVVDRAGQPVGAVPLLLRRQLTVSSANIVPIPYLGPIVPSEVVQETTREVLRWARRRGVVRLELCLTPHANAPDQTMAAVGLAEERVETFMVDLAGRGESELFAAIGGQARTAVRRSERKGVTIRTATAEDLRTVLPAVHEEALGGPRPYAHRLGDALARAGIPVPARCATAVVDGEAIGVSITLAGCSAV